jgi:hypothetical protein
MLINSKYYSSRKKNNVCVHMKHEDIYLNTLLWKLINCFHSSSVNITTTTKLHRSLFYVQHVTQRYLKTLNTDCCSDYTHAHSHSGRHYLAQRYVLKRHEMLLHTSIIINHLRYEILKVVRVLIFVFWIVMPCSFAGGYGLFPRNILL